MKRREKPKKTHLIKVQFNTVMTADTAKAVLRRALIAAQAQKVAAQAAWESARSLAFEPTVLPLPKSPKPPKPAKKAKKARKAKRRSR